MQKEDEGMTSQLALERNGKEKQNKLEFHGSRLARLLYSQNIQRGPPLAEYQEVLWRFALFVISQSEYANEVLKYANEVFSMPAYLQQQGTWIILYTWITLEFTATHLPNFATVPQTFLWIFAFFVISQSEQICKWDIDHVHPVCMGKTDWVHFYPHTKFHHCSPYRSFDICIFCY